MVGLCCELSYLVHSVMSLRMTAIDSSVLYTGSPKDYFLVQG